MARVWLYENRLSVKILFSPSLIIHCNRRRKTNRERAIHICMAVFRSFRVDWYDVMVSNDVKKRYQHKCMAENNRLRIYGWVIVKRDTLSRIANTPWTESTSGTDSRPIHTDGESISANYIHDGDIFIHTLTSLLNARAFSSSQSEVRYRSSFLSLSIAISLSCALSPALFMIRFVSSCFGTLCERHTENVCFECTTTTFFFKTFQLAFFVSFALSLIFAEQKRKSHYVCVYEGRGKSESNEWKCLNILAC